MTVTLLTGAKALTKRLVITQQLLCLSVILACSLVQAETDYDVEVVIFEHLNGSFSAQWAPELQLNYPSRSQAFSQRDSGIIRQDTGQLSAQAGALKSNRHYRVLFHQAWRQPLLPPRDTPYRILPTSSPLPELSGALRLSFQEGVRLDTRLWLARFQPVSTPSSIPSLPAPPSTEGEFTAMTARLQPSALAQLASTQRLKPGQVTYLDNAKLGVLIWVNPSAP
jgi:hypothetical protein